jgi:hypothetical protein
MRVAHESVAMKEVQERRRVKAVPGGRPIHDYANLYFCARNPMLFKRRDEHESLCVLRISPAVLDLPDVVVTDQNAASDYARFARAPEGLEIVDRALVFAAYWKHPEDPIADWRHASAKCAEVLVPDCVEPSYITGAYVSCGEAQAAVAALDLKWPIAVNPSFFFR